MQVSGFPRGCAENTIVPDERGMIALVRPSIAAPMQTEVTKFLIHDESPEAMPDTTIQAVVILTSGGCNHVEVTPKKGPAREARTS